MKSVSELCADVFSHPLRCKLTKFSKLSVTIFGSTVLNPNFAVRPLQLSSGSGDAKDSNQARLASNCQEWLVDSLSEMHGRYCRGGYVLSAFFPIVLVL
jgi:hypothetical protein